MVCSAAALLVLLAHLPQGDPPTIALFDGATLNGWQGQQGLWRVEDGCLVGSTREQPITQNSFLVWQGTVRDFVFTAEVQLHGDNNSGVQYRSHRVGEFGVAGYQADVHAQADYLGMLYEEKGAGIVCKHGRFVARDAAGKLRDLGAIAPVQPQDLTQWHQLRIVARGNLLWHEWDGRPVAAFADDAPQAPRDGVLALQLHSGAPMEVRWRKLTLQVLPREELALVPSSLLALAARDRQQRSSPPGTAPQWIWDASAEPDEELFFRKTFSLAAAPQQAKLRCAADNHWRVWLNGERVQEGQAWERLLTTEVAAKLRQGENVLAVYASNEGGPAGLALRLDWQAGKQRGEVVSDASWLLGADDPDGWEQVGFPAAGWVAAHALGAVGAPALPWSRALGAEQFVAAPADQPQIATKAVQFTGMGSETAVLLLDVPREYGSWVAMCADDRGRLYASDQNSGLFMVRPAARLGELSKIEPMPVVLAGCQGLCWHRGALYAVANGRESGLLRIVDSDGDDRLDHAQWLARLDGGGEHGPHAVVVAPDGEHLLVLCGNHTRVPPLAASRVASDWGEDRLLPKLEDPNGHAVGIAAPGGFVCSVDADGKNWELLCCGFRNAYDLAALPDGRIITYDADMEWDMGLPWYRPTRLLEVRPGVDYGWRSGANKWPLDYPDTGKAICELGPGSPTGVVCHQDHLLALDWTFGTIHALPAFLDDPFVLLTGAPFPVVDAVSLDDRLLVLTGGRGLPSQLFAFSPKLPAALGGLTRVLPPLPEELTRLVAQARAGAATTELLPALAAIDWASLSAAGRIAWLRAHALTLLRGKECSMAARAALGQRLLAMFPTGDDRVDADLAELLAFLQVEGLPTRAVPLLGPLRYGEPPAWASVIARNANYGGAIASMLQHMPPTAQIAFAYSLACCKVGWSHALRSEFLTFLARARQRKGGASYDGYLKQIGTRFWANCPPEQQVGLTELAAAAVAELPRFASTPSRGPGRHWTVAEAQAELAPLGAPDLAAGRNLFHATGCANCHYFAGEGGSHGPDLSSLANKFSVADLLEAILLPSKVISDQYAGQVVTTHDGKALFGRASKHRQGSNETWHVVPATAQAEVVVLPAAQVRDVAPSPLSPMPERLVDGLSPAELHDLLGYLRSRGGR